MTITNINIPVELFQDETICDTQRHVLGLVISFNSHGLKLSNQQLANIFVKNPNYIGNLINDLEEKNKIRIVNKQSKYRTIYLQENMEVKENELPEKPVSKIILLPENNGLLTGFTPPTSRKTCNINKRNEINKIKRKNTKRKTFQIPTLEEIESYISEKQLDVDGKYFLEYFTEGNWIDSKGNEVRNWKQKLLTWNKHIKPGRAKPEQEKIIFHEPTDEEADALFAEAGIK